MPIQSDKCFFFAPRGLLPVKGSFVGPLFSCRRFWEAKKALPSGRFICPLVALCPRPSKSAIPSWRPRRREKEERREAETKRLQDVRVLKLRQTDLETLKRKRQQVEIEIAGFQDKVGFQRSRIEKLRGKVEAEVEAAAERFQEWSPVDWETFRWRPSTRPVSEQCTLFWDAISRFGIRPHFIVAVVIVVPSW